MKVVKNTIIVCLFLSVDDGYPSVVIGRTTPSKGVNGEFNEYLALKDGASISKDDIKEVLTYEQADPDLFKDFSDEDKAKMDAEIAKYKQDAELFWKTAETQKGKVMDFQAKGKAKNDEVTLENVKIAGGTNRIANYWEYLNDKERLVRYRTECEPDDYILLKNEGKSLINYMSACGLVAAGFVLDYLTANGLAPKWRDLSFEEKGKYLKNEMYAKDVVIADKWKGRMVWPHNLGNSISNWSDYRRTVSLCICPEKALDQGLPGINLRMLKATSWQDFTAGPHYRAVIGYKKPGWFIFKWWQIKILDLVDCSGDELTKGRWENYIPFYHFASYNILHK